MLQGKKLYHRKSKIFGRNNDGASDEDEDDKDVDDDDDDDDDEGKDGVDYENDGEEEMEGGDLWEVFCWSEHFGADSWGQTQQDHQLQGHIVTINLNKRNVN